MKKKIALITGITGQDGAYLAEFASLVGVSVRTLQEWEQGRRTPTGPARALLRVAEHHPEALLI